MKNKILNIFVIFYLGHCSLLFSDSPWQIHLDEMQAKSASGDPNAQGILSVYVQAQASSGTNDEAFALAEKSANMSSPFGIYALGRCYEKGIQVNVDNAKAQNLYSKAFPALQELAQAGDQAAQLLLGACYEAGRGVPKDESEAVKWYRKSADQGNANAQCSLGSCYQQGRGVPKDESEAVKWYRKSADQGNAFGQLFLGECYEAGRGVPKDESEAVKWYRKSADQDLNHAKLYLARAYAEGVGGQKNINEAAELYRRIPEDYKQLEYVKPLANSVLKLLPIQEKLDFLQKSYKENQEKYSSKYSSLTTEVGMKADRAPTKDVILGHLWQICKAMEEQFNDSSFTINRGEALSSLGLNGIPVGITLYPIRLSGSMLQYSYLFYQDEFGDWKAVER